MTRAARTILATTVVVATMCCSAGAGAREATSAQVRDLAERALNDQAALDQLRTIDSVDGRPADLAAAFDEDDPALRAQRLRTLAGSGSGASVDAADARAEASDVLSQARYNPSRVPRPFQGVLDRLGNFLDRNLTRPVGRLWERLVELVPGGATTLWILLCIFVVGVIALVVWRIGRRRRKAAADPAARAEVRARRESAKELERQAVEAETRGDLAEAVRLRFRAGLLRLDDAGAIAYRASLSAGQVRRRLKLKPFDVVAGSFEAVTYGGRAATDDDVEVSKLGWKDVMERVSS